jgi:hypothetical protein
MLHKICSHPVYGSLLRELTLVLKFGLQYRLWTVTWLLLLPAWTFPTFIWDSISTFFALGESFSSPQEESIIEYQSIPNLIQRLSVDVSLAILHIWAATLIDSNTTLKALSVNSLIFLGARATWNGHYLWEILRRYDWSIKVINYKKGIGCFVLTLLINS